MKTNELQNIKTALLRELDVTLQQCCHQRLKDVINDLHIHYVNVKPDSSPDDVFSIVLESGVLKTVSASPVVQMRASLERLRKGTFGFCTLCGREIMAKYLEQHPTTMHCESCDKESGELMRSVR